jgi:hypothetical protein
MERCCIHQIAIIGIVTGFEPAEEGDVFVCAQCAARYVLTNGKWRRDEETGTR